MKDSTRVGSSERLEIPGFTLCGEASIWITSERWREGPLPKNVDFHTSAWILRQTRWRSYCDQWIV